MEQNEEENWIETEFARVNLGDKRRDERLKHLAAALWEHPSVSLPEAMGNWSDLKAAYRFFDNPANESEAILAGHIQSSYKRMAQFPIVLAVQDTTYLDFTQHAGMSGIGPTTSSKQWGLVVHSTVAITPERIMLGVMQQQVWHRDADTYGNLKDHKQRKIEEKESNKWLISLESAIEAHKANPNTHFISMGDREADVYDLFVKERPAGVDLLVRAIRDRRIEDDEHRYLWKALQDTPVVATLEVQVSDRPNQPARIAHLEAHWKKVVLRPPTIRLKSERLPEVTIWAVWAVEPHPPDGAQKVEWMVLNTLPVISTEDALLRLEWYACRWGIEVWHKVLKSGCKIESRQLADAENLKRLLVVYSVIAWRIMYATMFVRAVPDAPCTVLFEADEWQALYCTVHKTTILPEQEPTLREAVRMVGRLGGFLGRKSDGEPGVKALWTGFQRLNDLTLMYKILRPPNDPAK